MITQEQQKQGAEFISILVQKSWESSTFKEQFIKNPRNTIESVTGQKIDSNVNIIVEDQTVNSIIFLNIPRKVEFESLELNDEQLEMIAGGEIGIALGILGVAALVGAGYAFAAYNAPPTKKQ
jgi:hypothetical protein